MAAALINFVSQFLSLSWLTGPIFDKELRVSSRRRRNYILRFTYLALLTIFLVLVWLEEVKYRGSAAYRISRMARAGQTITVFIIWFQFCITQLIAIIILSTSISDEIYNRTLGLLMTTPINSFQIVMGKLFSKLLQLILLLAVSLPLLAIVRVFGGVPWDYVITSLCITLTAIIFVGSLSLFFSIFSRRAYVVIIETVLTLGAFFALLPFLVAMFWHTLQLRQAISENTLFTVLFHPNPYGIMAFTTEMMVNPRGGGGMPTLIWPLHCVIMLAASALVLAFSVKKVRKVALRQAIGQFDTFRQRRRLRKKSSLEATVLEKSVGRIRRINGLPAIWKELRTPMFRGRKLTLFIVISLGLVVLSITYFLCAQNNMLDSEEAHMIYTTVFLSLGILFTIVIPPTCITSEKESRSWPLLLATTLSDWHILFGKFIGAVRRCLSIWVFLFGHIIFFSYTGWIHPIAILQIAILTAWIIVFFSCTGLYFSSRFKHTTTAVVMNFGLAAVIWGLIPLLMVLIMEITRMGDDLVENYCNAIPFVQALVVMDATAHRGALGTFNWPEGNFSALGSTFFMLAFMICYIFLGFLFAWRAKCQFRRNIF
jgi:ABC-type transport system involved in multi-copper enzyme maturation permease subunit